MDEGARGRRQPLSGGRITPKLLKTLVSVLMLEAMVECLNNNLKR